MALAKLRPGQINYASAGNGSTHHLSGELLKMMAGIDIVHIPYKGSSPAIAALIGGEVSIMFATVTGIQPQIKAGRARGLAVTTPQRSAMMPGLPTMAETLPGFEMLSWFGLLAPAGTPRAVIDKLNAQVNTALRDPALAGQMTGAAMDLLPGPPEAVFEFIGQERSKWGAIVKAKGIRLDP